MKGLNKLIYRQDDQRQINQDKVDCPSGVQAEEDERGDRRDGEGKDGEGFTGVTDDDDLGGSSRALDIDAAPAIAVQIAVKRANFTNYISSAWRHID